MKALKLKLYQETACYTKPFSYKVGATYPLPPYSTVIGMLHRVLEATSYHDMKVSIQGMYEDQVVDVRSTYLYKGKEVTKSPLNIHLLVGVSLIIHVHAEEDLLQRIHDRLRQGREFLSLGRKEDLVRMDEIRWVEMIREESLHHHTLTSDIYIPIAQLEDEDTPGIRFRLNTQYQVIGSTRVWDQVDVIYLTAGDELNEERYLKDEEGNLVYFHSPL